MMMEMSQRVKKEMHRKLLEVNTTSFIKNTYVV